MTLQLDEFAHRQFQIKHSPRRLHLPSNSMWNDSTCSVLLDTFHLIRSRGALKEHLKGWSYLVGDGNDLFELIMLINKRLDRRHEEAKLIQQQKAARTRARKKELKATKEKYASKCSFCWHVCSQLTHRKVNYQFRARQLLETKLCSPPRRPHRQHQAIHACLQYYPPLHNERTSSHCALLARPPLVHFTTSLRIRTSSPRQEQLMPMPLVLSIRRREHHFCLQRRTRQMAWLYHRQNE